MEITDIWERSYKAPAGQWHLYRVLAINEAFAHAYRITSDIPKIREFPKLLMFKTKAEAIACGMVLSGMKPETTGRKTDEVRKGAKRKSSRQTTGKP